MDPSNAQHHAMATHTLEDALACSKPQQERRLKPQPEQALKCPRCDSTNTKFCYYNNYSLSQPRYFCKGCRRYWTKGGSLRNVPVGGGCKRNKRSSSSKRTQDQAVITSSNPIQTLPPLTYNSSDLTLAFSRLHKQPNGQLGLDDHDTSILGNPNTTHYDIFGNPNTTTPGFLDALRSGFLDTQNGFHNFYHGFGNGNMGEATSGTGACAAGEGMVMPYNEYGSATTTTTTAEAAATLTATIKQEYCKGGDSENKVLWGFPWQQVGGDGNMGGADSGRGYWNGLGPSWHGIVNDPLM